MPQGTEVLAAEQGTVAYAGSELKGYGNLILLRHDNGYVTAYAHNEEILVKRGDKVKRGQPIAKVGHSGRAGACHVHFGMSSNCPAKEWAETPVAYKLDLLNVDEPALRALLVDRLPNPFASPSCKSDP